MRHRDYYERFYEAPRLLGEGDFNEIEFFKKTVFFWKLLEAKQCDAMVKAMAVPHELITLSTRSGKKRQYTFVFEFNTLLGY